MRQVWSKGPPNSSQEPLLKELTQMNKSYSATISSFETDQFKRTARDEIQKWLLNMNPDIFLTLTFNREMTGDHARDRLGNLLARIDEKFIGARWQKKVEDRSELVFFPENMRTNFHYHGIGRLPPHAYRWATPDLSEKIDVIWKKLMPSGTINVQRIDRSPDKLVGYVTKQLTRPDALESFVTSRDFWTIGRSKM